MSIEKSATRYYSAVLVFENSSPAPDHPPLYEEQIVLLVASSEEDARAKALAYGTGEEFSYQNCYGETITVSFKLLLDVRSSLYEGEPIGAGTEVYGRYFRDYAAYEAFEPLLKGQSL